MAADDGEGGAQLVPGVVGELPPAGEGPFQPVEHRVEGLGERGDVVLAPHRDPLGEVPLGQPGGGGPHQPHGGEDAARDHPADAGGQRRRHPGYGGQDAERLVGDGLLAAGVEGDDEGGRRAEGTEGAVGVGGAERWTAGATRGAAGSSVSA